jgi:hypothetical protein
VDIYVLLRLTSDIAIDPAPYPQNSESPVVTSSPRLKSGRNSGLGLSPHIRSPESGSATGGSSSVAAPRRIQQPFYLVPVVYGLVIGQDPGSVLRGFG